MGLIVQKFGGSSLASAEHVRGVAEQVLAARRGGHDVVVVVSAMGSTTSDLLNLAANISNDPSPRELDALLSTGECVSMSLLAMALQRRGVDAISLTGAQGGIRTNPGHFNTTIERVETTRVRFELDAGRVVVVAGYQGEDPTRDVATLGIGGSDVSAVALAGALGAERCEICSDVDGVYTADPGVVGDAQRLAEISYAEMIELARHGAGVLNPRAVEHARESGVEIFARSTFEPERGGTFVRDVARTEGPRVVAVASHDNLLPVRIENRAADRVGDAVLACLGKDDVFVDHTDSEAGRRELLIPHDDMIDPAAFARRVRRQFGEHVALGAPRGSVSAIGLRAGAAQELRAGSRARSREAGIELHGDYRDEHWFTCLIEPRQVERALNLLHDHLQITSEAA